MSSRQTMFAWLAAEPEREQGVDQLIAPLEALAVLRRDLDVRLQAAGAGSVAEAFAIHGRLLRALRSMSAAELHETCDAVDGLRTHLMRLGAHLAELRRLHDRVVPRPPA